MSFVKKKCLCFFPLFLYSLSKLITQTFSLDRVFVHLFPDLNIPALYLKYIQDLNQAATIMHLSSIQPQNPAETSMSDLLNLIQNKRRAAKPGECVQRTPAPPSDDVFSCPKCAKTYLRQYTLNAHLRYECGKRPKFKCPHCNKKCHQKCNLKSHIALKHDQVTQI